MLCDEHFEAVEAGERWVVDMATGRASVLMGSDLPPSFNRWQAVEGHLSSAGDSLLMRLELQRPDGSMSDIDVEMTAEQARGLEEVLHVGWVESPPDEHS
jgi:hypothetical protein